MAPLRKQLFGQAVVRIPEDMSSLTSFDDMTDNFSRKCGIICTMGPASWDIDRLTDLMREGVNICRLNLAHGDREDHLAVIKRVREVAKKFPNRQVAIMLDTRGPVLRTGVFRPGVGKQITLEQGQELKLVADYSFLGDNSCIAISYDRLCTAVTTGGLILCADGALSLCVKSVHADHVVTEVMNSFQLGERKNCKLVAVRVDLPVLQEQDVRDIAEFAIPQGIDILGVSSVRCAADVRCVRESLGARGKGIVVMSKIQCDEALRNIDEIIEASDAIMVARGDLGMHIPPENVFLAQKQIVASCNAAGRPVAVATQMMESMIRQPRPTRAEASDVANAVLDGADCMMLSGETALGAFPVDAVAAVRRVCMEAELVIDYPALFLAMRASVTMRNNTARASLGGKAVFALGVAEAVCSSAVEAAEDSNARLIVALTASGSTAMLTAKYRPQVPILAVSASEATLRRLQLCRGISPLLLASSVDAIPSAGAAPVQKALEAAKRQGMVRSGDVVVVVHGTQEETEGQENLAWTAVVP